MGILRGTARLLLEEHRRRPFGGSVLQLGKSFVFFGPDDLSSWARSHRVELRGGVDVRASHDPELAAAGCMDDRSFFRLLGFDEVLSSDVRRWEGADLVLDLNRPVPEEQRGRFDAVFEAGTLQHVFDLRQGLRNVADLLRPGGRALHGLAPANNHVDHGFVSFSPTFFHDFYTANGFVLEKIYLVTFLPFWIRGRLDSAPWNVYEYRPGCLDHLSYGRFGSGQAGIFVVATKTAESTSDRVPQQTYYEELWDETGESDATDVPDDPGPVRAPPHPWLHRPLRWAKALRERVRRLGPRRMPRRVGRV